MRALHAITGNALFLCTWGLKNATLAPIVHPQHVGTGALACAAGQSPAVDIWVSPLPPQVGRMEVTIPHTQLPEGMAEQFIHLHLHTDYSLLDGACDVHKLVDRVHSLGMPAVAMTDHGNIFVAVHFVNAANKEIGRAHV